ncbi:zinc-binding dehydrogenase [Lutispora thermophila]|uniref:Ribitol-5-phosphate 2-dehydrogenase n=1 Tax=Lutispora thermophila DSM 19022 TaxID=1122184 RepID=A0A1M6BY56_9FIRM|nr:zinc-binding dehydrogenase [Lutispora thermophila]SHI53543.1 ribitol-5-phosphate 2-dehydrogenase [Lutispora thermophila DSM 19022]
MLTKSYKIVQPKRFEIYIDNIEPKEDDAIIKIEYAAICKADIRYYLGKRDMRVLDKKYPMSLLHEAVGIVIKDYSGKFTVGEKVALVPNIVSNCMEDKCTNKVCLDNKLGQNYCPRALFASSNYNGFSRSIIAYPSSNIVRINNNIDLCIAVFAELISVANAAIRRIDIDKNDRVAVWGDGILGYILCSVLHNIYDVNFTVIGKHEEKLKEFTADKYILLDDEYKLTSNVDIVFECVGGSNSENAINQIIDTINPGGKIVLAGVPDKNPNIDVRKVLEKGISIYGVTRSNVNDFYNAISQLENDNFYKCISKLFLDELIINDITDYYKAFEMEILNRKLGKNILKFRF